LITSQIFERAGRFSFAYLVRRTDNVNRRTPPSVWVVVYQGRSMDSPSDEKAYLATISVPTISGTQTIPDMPSQVQLTFTSGNAPAIRVGGWIMDSSLNPTVNSTSGIPTASTSTSTIQGYFYRVTDILNQTATTVDIQLDRPLKYGNETPGTTANTRIFVVPESVVHVAQVN